MAATKSYEIEDWLNRSMTCECGQEHAVPLKHVIIKRGALQQIPAYCKRQSYRKLMLVVDTRTERIAGRNLQQLLLREGIQVSLCVLEDNARGEVAADEETIVQTLLRMPQDVDAIAAVGSGTIHDIVRFVSYKTNRTFVSVPTAPSVDGFSSVGAPLIIKGFKQTVPACAPEAIFADLDILCKAPQAMVAAGLADMLGKYTSLADWKLGNILYDEYYCPLCADMTEYGLQICIDYIDAIAERSTEGIQRLMEGLIWSGISMLMLGNSRPASGGEHHLSHYWEMKLIQDNQPAILHGAKVGVAAIEMAKLYDRLKHLTLDEVLQIIQDNTAPTVEQDIQMIQRAYGLIADEVIAENELRTSTGRSLLFDSGHLMRMIKERWQQLLLAARDVPSAEQLSAWLAVVGGPISVVELHISDTWKQEALQHAMFVRNRFTIMRLMRWLEPNL